MAMLLAAAIACLPRAAAQVRIVDPERGAYVSGEYEIVLEAANPEDIVQTRLIVDGETVFEGEGWQARMTIDFGDDIARREIYAEVTRSGGVTERSGTVVTRALRIDVEETTRLILLGAMVKTRSNQPISGLEKGDFQVFEDGKRLEIETFYKEKLPLDLVFLLDTSSSLRDGGIDEVRFAAATFLSGLEPTDRVALYEFKGEPRKLAGFTTDRKRLREKIAQLEPIGETALFDALLAGLVDLKGRRKGRKALVLFTDGRDNIYDARGKARMLRRGITQAQNHEAAIFTIGLGDKVHREALGRISEETGGRFHYADRPGRLREVFDEIILDLKNQYMLGVRARASRRGFHSLEVKVRQRGAVVYARTGYTIQ